MCSSDLMTFPEGIDWGGSQVKVVIGIAGVGEEHLQILSVIADKMLDESVCMAIPSYSVEEVYEVLMGKE